MEKTTLTYNSRGNLPQNDQSRLFICDAWNRSVAVEHANTSLIVASTYDGLGRRSQSITCTGTAGTSTTDVCFSASWQNLEERTTGTLDERLYTTSNARFDVTTLVDTTGTVQECFNYDAYFKRTHLDDDFTADNRTWTIGAQGLMRDENTGLWSARNRWFSDSLMVWITQDPIRDGMNWYEGFAANPINGLDSTGLYMEGGHFWTVYMVARAVGAPAGGWTPLQAQEYAYFAQYPDLLDDLDAFSLNKAYVTASPAAKAIMLNRIKFLHSLPDETNNGISRRKCLAKMLADKKRPSWQRGFLAHALGDAYSHTEINAGSEHAYPPRIGHGTAGDTPDLIVEHLDKYKDYVNQLFLELGGDLADPKQKARLDAIIAFAATLPSNGEKEAAAMQAEAIKTYGFPAGPAAFWMPTFNNHGTDPAMAAESPSLADIDKFISEIEKACPCVPIGTDGPTGYRR